MTDHERAIVAGVMSKAHHDTQRGAWVPFWDEEGWVLFSKLLPIDGAPKDLREVGVVAEWLIREPEHAVVTAQHIIRKGYMQAVSGQRVRQPEGFWRASRAARWVRLEIGSYVGATERSRLARLGGRMMDAPLIAEQFAGGDS